MTDQTPAERIQEKRFNHNKVDYSSETLHEVARFLSERLSALREQNDKLTDHDKTCGLRGQIKEVKMLLSACKPKKTFQQPGK